MTTSQPTLKDIAEFFRLGLLAGLCGVGEVSRWAEFIVASEKTPHFSFIDLCLAGSEPNHRVQSLLHDVPGLPTPELAERMLLGHAARLVSAGRFAPEQLLLRVYHLTRLETFSARNQAALIHLEDSLSLARDGVYGTMEAAGHDAASFFNEYQQFAPDPKTLGSLR